MDYLSLCLICKDENHYIQEWLDYHILVGIQRFYIYDNESRVPVRETLAEYIQKGWVVVIDIKGRPVQLHAYDHCVTTFGHYSKWIGFIDTDEFLVPKKSTDVKEVLREYEEFGGLAVSSCYFGSDGHRTPPVCGQLAGYRKRANEYFSENYSVKSIVQPDKVKFAHTPHEFFYKKGICAVNEDRMSVHFQLSPFRAGVIQLNHYYCRSLDEIEQKLQRGRGDSKVAWGRHRFDVVNTLSTDEDTSVYGLLEKVINLYDPQGWKQELLDQHSTRLLDTLHQCAQKIVPTPHEISVPDEVITRQEFLEWLQIVTELRQAKEELDSVRAKAVIDKMLHDYPDEVFILTDAGRVCVQRGEYTAAWKLLTYAWELAPADFTLLDAMTEFFRATKQVEAAEKTVRLRLSLCPHDTKSLGYLALILLDMGRYEDSLKVGLPVIDLNWLTREIPDRVGPELNARSSEVLYRIGDKKKAVKILQKTITRWPKSTQAHVQLAKIYLAEKRVFDARQLVREAEKIWPNDPEMLELKKVLSR